MIKLLTLKVGKDYIRQLDDGYQLCNMNKASVYPLEQIATVRLLEEDILKDGMKPQLVQLTITEEPYTE